jgi:hypothetical protein
MISNLIQPYPLHTQDDSAHIFRVELAFTQINKNLHAYISANHSQSTKLLG